MRKGQIQTCNSSYSLCSELADCHLCTQIYCLTPISLELDEFSWCKIVFASVCVCVDDMGEIYNRNWVQK